MVVLVTVDSPDHLGPILVFDTDIVGPPDDLETNKLLIELTGSIVNAAKRSHGCNVDVIIRLNVLPDRMKEVSSHAQALIRCTTCEAVDQHNWIVVSPEVARDVADLAMTCLIALEFIVNHTYFVNKINSQHHEHNIPILVTDVFSQRFNRVSFGHKASN